MAREAVSIYRRYPRHLLTIAAIGLPFSILSVAMLYAMPGVLVSPFLAWMPALPFVVPHEFVSAALVYAVATAQAGSEPKFADSYRAAASCWKTLVAVALIDLGVTGLLPVTIVGAPIAVYLTVRWAFALQAAVLEGKTTGAALDLSRRLVRGRWWQIAGVLLVVISPVIILLFASVGIFLFAGAIPRLVTVVTFTAAAFACQPFIVGALTLLFEQLKRQASPSEAGITGRSLYRDAGGVRGA